MRPICPETRTKWTIWTPSDASTPRGQGQDPCGCVCCKAGVAGRSAALIALVISTVSAVRAAAASLKQLLHVPTSRVMATMAKRGERQRTYITGNQVQMLCEHVAGYRGGRRRATMRLSREGLSEIVRKRKCCALHTCVLALSDKTLSPPIEAPAQ